MNHQTNILAAATIIVFLVFTALTSTAQDAKTARLRVSRASDPLFVYSAEVLINGERVGQIRVGNTETFEFVPLKSKNTVKFKIIPFFGSDVESKEYDFQPEIDNIYSMVIDVKSLNWHTPYISIEDKTPQQTKSSEIDNLRVALDPETKHVEGYSETVTLPAGVVVKTKKSRTIEHSIMLSDDSILEGSIRANLLLISAAVRKNVEEKVGRNFKQSETAEQEILLDGNIHQKYTLTWLDKIRSGVVVFSIDGNTKKLPFEFREWSELKILPSTGGQ